MTYTQVVTTLSKRGTPKMWLYKKFDDIYNMPRSTFWLKLKNRELTKKQQQSIVKIIKSAK